MAKVFKGLAALVKCIRESTPFDVPLILQLPAKVEY